MVIEILNDLYGERRLAMWPCPTLLNQSTSWKMEDVGGADLQQVKLNPPLHVHDLVLPSAHLLALEGGVLQDRLDASHPAQVGEQAHLQGATDTQMVAEMVRVEPVEPGSGKCSSLADIDPLPEIF